MARSQGQRTILDENRCSWSPWMRGLGALGGLMAGMTMATTAAWGHGAHIQARPSQAVEIQATYDSGDPLAEAQVQVYGPDDPQTPRFTGLTDAQGRYLFTPDTPGDWEVSVRQAGHGDIAVIPVTEAGVIASTYQTDSGLSPLQRGLMAGAVTWGCVGTALYFRRSKR
jgi:nickel transport protein